MSILDHIFLYTILFSMFFFATRISQQFINKHYWKVVSILIIFYSLILGSRYGWGNDYLWYKFRFEHPFAYKEENVGFRTLNIILAEIGLNYIGAYIFYSFIYITTAYILIKDYKENKYMLALFLPATLLQSTFTIRQSVAHSFIFLALHFLNHKKWIFLVLYLAITYSIHPGALLLIIPIFLFFLFYKKIISWKISIPIYITASLFTSFFTKKIIQVFTHFLPTLVLENKFDSYLQNDAWYNEDAIRETWMQSTLTLTLSMIFHIGIIYIGYISLKYRPKETILYFYNTVVIGMIITRFFWTFEIFRRISEPLIMLYFIPLGYSFYFLNHKIKCLSHKEKIISVISIIGMISYLLLYFGRFILQSPKYIFFWNK